MHRPLPVNQWLVLGWGDDGTDAFGKEGFGADKIDDGEEGVGLEDVWHERAEHVGKGGEDADDLTALFGFEFADAVIGFYNGFGLDVNRLARCRFVVDDAADAPLEGGCYGDDQSTVAHGGCCIAIYPSLGLRRAEDGLQVARDATRDGGHVATDARQLGGSAILRATVAVEDGVDATNKIREDAHATGYRSQHGVLSRRVVAFIHGQEEACDVCDGL